MMNNPSKGNPNNNERLMVKTVERYDDERKCPWKIECFLEDQFLGSQWSIIRSEIKTPDKKKKQTSGVTPR